MSMKRLKTCLRRWAWLIATAIGAVCAGSVGWIVCDNLMNGFTHLPQLVGVFMGMWAMVLAAEWLAGDENEIS